MYFNDLSIYTVTNIDFCCNVTVDPLGVPLTSDFHNYTLADVTSPKGQDTDGDLTACMLHLQLL